MGARFARTLSDRRRRRGPSRFYRQLRDGPTALYLASALFGKFVDTAERLAIRTSASPRRSPPGFAAISGDRAGLRCCGRDVRHDSSPGRSRSRASRHRLHRLRAHRAGLAAIGLYRLSRRCGSATSDTPSASRSREPSIIRWLVVAERCGSRNARRSGVRRRLTARLASIRRWRVGRRPSRGWSVACCSRPFAGAYGRSGRDSLRSHRVVARLVQDRTSPALDVGMIVAIRRVGRGRGERLNRRESRASYFGFERRS